MTGKPTRGLPSFALEAGDDPMTLHDLSLFAYEVFAVAQGLEILVEEATKDCDPTPATNSANCLTAILVDMADTLAGELDRAEMAAKRLQ
jgi:hypothetical protein